MGRTIWIALAFSIYVGGLAALKVSIATPLNRLEALFRFRFGNRLFH
jgi:hypothetical protein